MPDSYFAVACIILLGCLIAACLSARHWRSEAKGWHEVAIEEMQNASDFRAKLRQASKNDRRDERGRFAKAS